MAWTLVVPIVASVGFAAVAPADPVAGDQSAAATIDELSAQGYEVQINWVGGVSSVSLSRCAVNAIHNPNRSPGAQPANTTVYVDVQCPNEHDDSGYIDGTLQIG